MTSCAPASVPPAAARLLYQGPEQYFLRFPDAGGQADPPVQQIFGGKPKKLELGWSHYTRVTLTLFKALCSTLNGTAN
jgi:hypothetical protein